MLTTLLTTLFGPPTPRCNGSGSRLVAARRAATDEKYTARPLDFFPNPLVSKEELSKARKEGEVLDGMFRRYKREAGCAETVAKPKGVPKGRLRKCEACGEWCCNACRFHTSYRIVCSNPLLFSDEIHVPPGCSDHALLAPNKRFQTLQIRLRDHEHPYALALLQQYAHRWHGYCFSCLARVSASLVKQLDGRFEPCRCERGDAGKRYRGRWVCAGCFEGEVGEGIEGGFEGTKCRGRGCGRTVGEVGWERFQPVCGWCLRVVDGKGIEAAREALREGEGFEVLRRDSKIASR